MHTVKHTEQHNLCMSHSYSDYMTCKHQIGLDYIPCKQFIQNCHLEGHISECKSAHVNQASSLSPCLLAATFLHVWPHTSSCTVNLSQAKKGDLSCSLPVSTDFKVNLGYLNKWLHKPRLEEPLVYKGVRCFFSANYILTAEIIYTRS